MWDQRTFSNSSLPSQENKKYPHRSRGQLHRVRKSSASARQARLLRPEASVYRWRDDAFTSVSRSAASHAISADTTVFNCCAAECEGTGTDVNDGTYTSISEIGGGGIDTVGLEIWHRKLCGRRWGQLNKLLCRCRLEQRRKGRGGRS